MSLLDNLQLEMKESWKLRNYNYFLADSGSFGVILARYGSLWMILAHSGSFWPIPLFGTARPSSNSTIAGLFPPCTKKVEQTDL